MAIIEVNEFTSFKFDEEEYLHATILLTNQKQHIQNQISELARGRLELKFDPSNAAVFIQQEAEIQGGIIALKYLLTLSEESEGVLMQQIINSQSQES